jgi:AcrR family transcriptional regulator
MVERVKRRRTQAERREGTIRKILDATTETLIEDGYAGATVQRIAELAGVSQGGLFRHFPTREALMVAVGEDVGARILARYRRQFQALEGKEEPVMLAIRLLRNATRSRLNQAWYELSGACRTNPALRGALRPVAEQYTQNIELLARQLLPELAQSMGGSFAALVDTIVAIFDGEQMHRFVARQPAIEAARLELMSKLASALSERATLAAAAALR